MAGTNHQEQSRVASIVVLGTFNPAIFQPDWFAITNLIRREEAEKAEIGIVHKDATFFSTEWFKLEVTADRFSILTGDPTKLLPLRDLAVGTFKILEHTPLKAFGLNSAHHFKTDAADDWHRIGHHYAPKESWKDVLENPGMRVLLMEGKRPNSKSKYVWVRLEPSLSLEFGVDISVNEHFELDLLMSPQDRMKQYLKTVEDTWDGFIGYSASTCEELLRQVEQKKGGS
jgi:hypothetical protein